MKEFWRNKKVFLTGHTGFKGSWLSLWLQELGAEVTGYALPAATEPSLFDLANVSHNMCSIIGDVCDLPTLQKAMQQAEPDIVIHLAAQALVRPSYQQPVETYRVNVMGLVHLLEAVRHTQSVKAVVNVTTDKCYQNQEWLWGYRENEPMGGYDPYSNSKACSELITSAYRNSFFNPEQYAHHGVALASARAGNVIGGGDWALDRLIPDILRSMSQQQPVLIRNPLAIRPWQHVLEPLHGYLTLAQSLFQGGASYAEAWNFGPEDSDARPVQWIVEYLCQRWEGGSWQLDSSAQPHEAHYLKLDCSKAKARLDWQPQYRLEQALDKILAWQQAYVTQQDMREFSLKQIRDFMEQL